MDDEAVDGECQNENAHIIRIIRERHVAPVCRAAESIKRGNDERHHFAGGKGPLRGIINRARGLARSQKLGDVEAMDRFELSLQQEAAIDPSVLDVYDFEAASRMRSQLLGVPQKLVRDKQTTAAVREGKKQAAQDAQQQAIAAQGQAEMQGAMAQRVMKTA